MATNIILGFLLVNIFLSVLVLGNTSIEFSAEEEVNGQQLLGNLITKMNDTYGINLNGYTFQIPAGDHSNYFIVTEGGDFSVVQKIDRESICSTAECVIHLNIYAILGSNFHTIKVNVTIQDKNDKRPEFSSNVFRLSIPEGTGASSSYELPSAMDYDTGNNRISYFTLEPNDGSFSIVNHTNLDGSIGLNLVINLSLDRESQDIYRLLIRAVDGGTPALTGTLTVEINVTDINDNRPVFNPQKYNVTIDENIAVNTAIVTVTATDRDIGENARLSYSFTKMEPSSIVNVIGIQEATGKIFMNERLNSQTGPFTLFVEAADHGNPVKRSYQAEVIINVRDINNNAPEILRITFINDGKIKEDSGIDFLVAIFDVRDADTGENGAVTCTTKNTAFKVLKREAINSNTHQFSVHVATKLDREVTSSYSVLINCSDNGETPLHTNTTFQVTIEDVNDNAPVFAQDAYSKDILENVSSGAILLKVSAHDEDIGLNGKINYTILPFGIMDMFYIGADGIIRAVQPFDRETKDFYEFHVLAKDNGSPSLNDTTRVTVRILDVNDNAPQFTGDSYAMAVLENSNISTSIGQVTASDADLGDNGQVSFTIPADYPESKYPFKVLDDGTVITTEMLDREDNNLYRFEILASDHGNPAKASRVDVLVSVLDVNDNKPFIEVPDDVNNTFSLPQDTNKNTIIYSVIAFDADENDGDHLAYSIVAGNSVGIFHIDNLGHISLTREIQNGDPKQFTLEISVKDQSATPLESTCTLHVSVVMATGSAGLGGESSSTGQNILIAIIMACVTLVLSIIIIAVICILRRKDNNQKALYNAKAYDEQKIIADPTRSSNRSNSSRGSRDKMLFPGDPGYGQADMAYYENGLSKKQVSFSMDEDQDTGISMETSGQYDPVTSFKSPSPIPAPVCTLVTY